jgi:Zn-dependent protease with chaperone function
MKLRGDVGVAKNSPSLTGRALVMLALFVGFYLLALTLATVLIAAPVLEFVLADRLHAQLLLASLAGLGILWALVPRRRETWVDPGPRFTAETQPELTALVHHVATSVGQQMPSALYLIDDMNAFVATRGGFMGIGGTRVLAVGVPLLVVLDRAELESVLAHEFGHFHGGDTRLLPLVYRTRGVMERTLATASGFVQGVFKAYASFYLARSQGISRSQEFAADQLAARVTAPHTAARALARLMPANAAFEYYRTYEYAPVLQAGRRPPYVAGFQHTLASSMMAGDGARSTDVALGTDVGSRFDSHPSPLDRIRALGVDPDHVLSRPWPSSPALGLLRDVLQVEAALVLQQLEVDPSTVPEIEWDDVGRDVVVPSWRAAVSEQLLPAVPDVAPGAVPTTPDDLATLGAAIFAHAGLTATRPEREAVARRLCAQYLGLAAVDAGWALSSLPGEPIRFTRDGETFDVLDQYTQACEGTIDTGTWRARMEAAGLGEVAAAPLAAPDGAGVSDTAAGVGGTSASRALQDTMTAAGAARGPGVATVVAAGAGPVALQYRAHPPGQGLRSKRELVIDGTTVRWGTQTIRAQDVTAAGYSAVGRSFAVRFATPDGELRFKLTGHGSAEREIEAWRALVHWFERYVEPRLIDERLAQIRATGRTGLGRTVFGWDGITTRKGLLPWDEFAGTAFTGVQVTLHRHADTLDGHVKAGAVKTDLANNGVLVAGLCRAILSSRR